MKNKKEKPKAKIIGENGNVFNLLGICSKALDSVGQRDKAKEMTTRVMASRSYTDALQIMEEYCELS